MSKEENNISTAALAVALIALLSTIGQVLQQYFATADGYRRCHSSVIGPWAERTRLRFRWRQLRFETLFTVPYLVLFRTTWASSTPPDCPFEDGNWIVDSETPDPKGRRIGHLISGKAAETPELVTWLRLLSSLQWTHKRMLFNLPKTSALSEKEEMAMVLQENRKLTIPIVRLEERSWDFMPPEVIKPYMRMNIGDLAVVARRLGMEWDRFEPSDGILRASGNGYNLTSVLVRSIGTMVEINEVHGFATGSSMPWLIPVLPEHVERKMLLMPCGAADKMGFGILPGAGSEFFYRDFDVSSLEAVRGALRYFTQDEGLVAAFAAEHWRTAGTESWCPGVSDLLPLIAPMMYRAELGIMGVPAPDNELLFRSSVTSHPASFREFAKQIRYLIDDAKPPLEDDSSLRWIHDEIESLQAISSSDTWTDPSTAASTNWLDEYWHDRRSQQQHSEHLASRIARAHRIATVKLQNHANPITPHRSIYHALLVHHLRSMFDHDRLPAEFAGTPGRYGHRTYPYPDPSGPEDILWTQRMAVYFRRLPSLVEDMMSKELGDPAEDEAAFEVDRGPQDKLKTAWCLMIFRAMCWWRCHRLVAGRTVPKEFCGSQMPVYIG